MSNDWPDSRIFWRDKRVIVTGGAGFLGSFVVEKLRERGVCPPAPLPPKLGENGCAPPRIGGQGVGLSRVGFSKLGKIWA